MIRKVGERVGVDTPFYLVCIRLCVFDVCVYVKVKERKFQNKKKLFNENINIEKKNITNACAQCVYSINCIILLRYFPPPPSLF